MKSFYEKTLYFFKVPSVYPILKYYYRHFNGINFIPSFFFSAYCIFIYFLKLKIVQIVQSQKFY